MPGAQEFRSDFDADVAAGEPAFTVNLDGFEGPLDLLLELARRQKVDLARISVLALAEQYLLFIEAARKLRLELATDYLVMAAWLACGHANVLEDPPCGRGGGDGPGGTADLVKRWRGPRQITRSRGADLVRRGLIAELDDVAMGLRLGAVE